MEILNYMTLFCIGLKFEFCDLSIYILKTFTVVVRAIQKGTSWLKSYYKGIIKSPKGADIISLFLYQYKFAS